MKIMEITPFIPLTLRGRFKGRALILRGIVAIWRNPESQA
jgi:hypothetical protein